MKDYASGTNQTSARGEDSHERSRRAVVSQHVIGIGATDVKIAVRTESICVRRVQPTARREDSHGCAGDSVVAENGVAALTDYIEVVVGTKRQAERRRKASARGKHPERGSRGAVERQNAIAALAGNQEWTALNIWRNTRQDQT